MPVIGIEKIIEFFLQNYLKPGYRVLDVGSGNGIASKHFLTKCTPTALDIKPIYSNAFATIQSNIMKYKTKTLFDAIWCSHLLEHMPNINKALKKIVSLAKENAPIAVVVPPRKDALVGGHLNLFTAGTLCYNIIMAGQNLSSAACIIHEYNIAVFWHKNQIILPGLKMDSGDIETLSCFFPKKVHQGIDGMKGWEHLNGVL